MFYLLVDFFYFGTLVDTLTHKQQILFIWPPKGGEWPRGASGQGGEWPGGRLARGASGPGGRVDVSPLASQHNCGVFKSKTQWPKIKIDP